LILKSWLAALATNSARDKRILPRQMRRAAHIWSSVVVAVCKSIILGFGWSSPIGMYEDGSCCGVRVTSFSQDVCRAAVDSATVCFSPA